MAWIWLWMTPAGEEARMKLSTKGRYAMVAMADLALQAEGEMTSLADIAKRRQDLSLPYLEQLFVRLRREG